MEDFIQSLKRIIDWIDDKLTWVDHIPSFIKSLIPALDWLNQVREMLQVLVDLLDGGDSEKIQQVVAILEQYLADMTTFSQQTVTKANLEALSSTSWTDDSAPENYQTALLDLPNSFKNVEDWTQAIITGLNADSGVIDDYYNTLVQILEDLVSGVLSLVGGILGIVGTAGLALAAGIVGIVSAVINLLEVVSSINQLYSMQAPTISPVATGQSWPVPVLWS